MPVNANRYLVKVMPGVYSERVTMKSYVDIEGAGELTTKITYTGGSSDYSSCTVVGANDTELRHLTAENRASRLCIAINNQNSSPCLTHVTATATGGGDVYGVFNHHDSAPVMTNVTVTVVGGRSRLHRCATTPASSTTIQNSTIAASGGVNNLGIYNSAGTGAYTVFVINSQVSGATYSISATVISPSAWRSQLSGGPVTRRHGDLRRLLRRELHLERKPDLLRHPGLQRRYFRLHFTLHGE